MSDPKKKLGADEVAEANLADWQQRGETITATYRTGDFATGLEFTNRIGAAAEDADHHPDILLTYPQVQVTLWSHDVGGLTSRDIRMALTISQLAAEQELETV
ncbi:4a-hydroxytetrahydrobiopterin dehydratase [Brevibacterium luteolum]|uniref:4a-hydroxytetrahydrobiopterin dehydratase n=1 Tax=Brevibacterium luteolum TaxID=199591 RepID=UPI003879ADEF